ncbi:MAG: energy-coupling factor transporter transmembrane protein EcfT [Pseudanabaenaceae cyanobacterium bins.68]|nr:energy-coupling factor transporter transmembrane protein EcfT [Pseudanabaenaceae cyanobacterium bins.68]
MDMMRSLSIGLYMEQPYTWLHRLDPRAKLFWLLSLLLSTVLAHNFWRLGMVLLLVLITLASGIPWRIWQKQMGLILILASLVFVLGMFSGDALQANPQPIRSLPEQISVENAPALEVPSPPPPTDYQYVLFKIGSVTVSQRSLDLATRLSTLLFTAVYSPTLFLLVTAPEEFTAALVVLLSPLRFLGLPTVEIALTLTLALRFLPLVLEEIQNLVRAIATRGINWQNLGWRRSIQVWLIVAERLLDNLFVRAEQTANAMEVRGFSSPNQHQIKWNELSLTRYDWLIGIGLVIFWGLRLTYGAAS